MTWATTLQIALVIAFPACLVWVATRPARRRGTGDPSSGDGGYTFVDVSSRDGSNSHPPGEDFSGPAGDSASCGDAASDGASGGSD